MTTGNKEIKFKMVVDETSVRNIHRVLDDLISKVRKLSEGLAGAGGSMFGGVTAGAGTASPQALNTGGGGRRQAQGTTAKFSFAGGMAESVATIKRAITEGTAGAKVLQDVAGRSMQSMGKEVESLTARINKLSEAYGRAAAAGDDTRRERLGSMVQRLHRRKSARVARLEEARDVFEADAPGGTIQPPLSRFGRAAAAVNRFAGSGLGQAVGGMAGTMLARGIGGGMLGQAIGGAAGALGGPLAWGLMGAAYAGRQIYDMPQEAFARRADIAQAFGAQNLRAMRGDYRYDIGRSSIFSDAGRTEQYMKAISGWRGSLTQAGGFLSSLVRGRVGQAFSGEGAQIALQETRQEFIDQELASKPITTQIMSEAQDFRGNTSLARAMGLGPGRATNSYYESVQKERARYSNYDASEIIAAKQGVWSTGTRKGSTGMAGAAMAGTAIGIHGIAPTLGTMTNFDIDRRGGRRGQRFADDIFGMVRGGVDVTTAGDLGAYVASQQQRFGVSTSTGAAYGGAGLLRMISTGTEGPGGRLAAQQNIRGAEYYQRLVSGETSGYQAARNLMIAQESAPGAGIYGQSFLANKMSLAELIQASEGGGLSKFAAAAGLDQKALRGQLAGVTTSMLEGVTTAGFGEQTPAYQMAQLLATESGGDLSGYIKKNQKALAKRFGGQEEADAALAQVLGATDTSMDPAAAMGLARDIRGGGVIKGARKDREETLEERGNRASMKMNTEALDRVTGALNTLRTEGIPTRTQTFSQYLKSETNQSVEPTPGPNSAHGASGVTVTPD